MAFGNAYPTSACLFHRITLLHLLVESTLFKAHRHLRLTYENYVSFPSTKRAVQEDAQYRFKSIEFKTGVFVEILTDTVIKYVDQIGYARNITRF